MNTVCYLLIFLFEQFVAYMYFKNKFETKRNTFVIAICYLLSFAVQFSVSLTGMAELNILSFLICNIIVVFVCFSYQGIFYEAITLNYQLEGYS